MLRIDDIEERANAATEGPWIPFRDDDSIVLGPLGTKADAEFVAHAREDIPLLIGRVRELEAERETLIEQVNDLNRQLVEWSEQAQREALTNSNEYERGVRAGLEQAGRCHLDL